MQNLFENKVKNVIDMSRMTIIGYLIDQYIILTFLAQASFTKGSVVSYQQSALF